jgi:hypothetical protein
VVNRIVVPVERQTVRMPATPSVVEIVVVMRVVEGWKNEDARDEDEQAEGPHVPGSARIGGRLVFRFGDSWTPAKKRNDEDSAAWTQSFFRPDRDYLPKHVWYRRDDGQFARLTIPNTSQEGMEVPVEGLVVGDRKYVFAVTGWQQDQEEYSHSRRGMISPTLRQRRCGECSVGLQEPMPGHIGAPAEGDREELSMEELVAQTR